MQPVVMTENPQDPENTLVFRRSDFSEGAATGIPEDLRHWLPAVRLVRLVGEVVNDVTPTGEETPDARTLAGILIWCLATGRYSSWDIEALCDEEPLARHLAGGLNPTHTDIWQFRRQHETKLTRALGQVLTLAAPAGFRRDFEAEASRRYSQARFADTLPPG